MYPEKATITVFLFVLGICSIFSASKLSMHWVTLANIDYCIFSLEELSDRRFKSLGGPIRGVY